MIRWLLPTSHIVALSTTLWTYEPYEGQPPLIISSQSRGECFPCLNKIILKMLQLARASKLRHHISLLPKLKGLVLHLQSFIWESPICRPTIWLLLLINSFQLKVSLFQLGLWADKSCWVDNPSSLKCPYSSLWSLQHYNEWDQVLKVVQERPTSVIRKTIFFLGSINYCPGSRVGDSGSFLKSPWYKFWAPDGLPDQNLRTTNLGWAIHFTLLFLILFVTIFEVLNL